MTCRALMDTLLRNIAEQAGKLTKVIPSITYLDRGRKNVRGERGCARYHY